MMVAATHRHFVDAAGDVLGQGYGMRREMLFMCEHTAEQQSAAERVKIDRENRPVDIVQLQPKPTLCDQGRVEGNALRSG